MKHGMNWMNLSCVLGGGNKDMMVMQPSNACPVVQKTITHKRPFFQGQLCASNPVYMQHVYQSHPLLLE